MKLKLGSLTIQYGKQELRQIQHARPQYAGKAEDTGQVASSARWSEKQPHPMNMFKYDDLLRDPEVGIGIDLLTDMIVGVGQYCEMPEKDSAGTKIDPEHPNKAIIDEWYRNVKFSQKMKEVERTKLGKGFCPVEILEDYDFKTLPPESIYIWRDKKGHFLKYTQDIDGAEVNVWENEVDLVLFKHNEDTSHPYGHALIDNVCELIEARRQINKDMPKIIHRYSKPLGIWEALGSIDNILKAVTEAGVDEDIFIPDVAEGEIRHTFIEPKEQVKFLPYIEQIYFQIAEALHAPLILLLKNATEASGKTMLESVDRFVQGEQRYDTDKIETTFFRNLVKDPLPLHKWGAPHAVLDEITLDQIGNLKGNTTITWEQAQDLIRQKGIPLIEVEKPEPTLPTNILEPKPELPLFNKPMMQQLEASLKVIRQNYEAKTVSLTEAIREGDRSIQVYVAKAKHEATVKLSEMLDKPVVTLSPESDRHFMLLRNEIFDQFRDSLLPTKLGGIGKVEPSSFTVTPNY